MIMINRKLVKYYLSLSILLILSVNRTLALIPEPSNIIYGSITIDGEPLTAVNNHVSLVLYSGEQKVTSYTMGDIPTMGDKYKLEAGDLLITEGGDWDKVGRTAIWEGEIDKCLHQNHVFKARVNSDLLMNRWVEIVFNSGVGRRYFAGASKQTTNLASINMTQLRSFPFPIPPLEEQKCIVTKVDQLMVLCDQLEQQLTQSYSDAEKLMQATVKALVA